MMVAAPNCSNSFLEMVATMRSILFSLIGLYLVCGLANGADPPAVKIPTPPLANSTPETVKLTKEFDEAAFLKVFLNPPPKIEFRIQNVIDYKQRNVEVTALALARDKSRLAIAYADGNVVIYDPATAKEVSRLPPALQGPTPTIAITSDGKYVLLGGSEKRGGLVVKSDTCEKVFVHDAPQSEIRKVIISEDDKLAMLLTKRGQTLRYPLLGGRGGAFPDHSVDKDCQFLSGSPATDFALVGTDENEPLKVNYHPLGFGLPTSYPFNVPQKPVHVFASHEFVMLVSQTNHLLIARPPTLNAPTNSVGASRLRGILPRHSAVLPDKEHFFLCDDTGNFEIRSLHAPALLWHRQFPQVKLSAAAMSADMKMIVTGYRTGQVFIFELPAAPAPIGLSSMKQLHALLIEQKYLELEALGLVIERETEPLSWSLNQLPSEMFESLLVTTPGAPEDFTNMDVALKLWMEARPDAHLPKLLMANRYVEKAWTSRGSGFANTVTEEGWRGFYKNIAKAEEIVIPIADLQKPPPSAFRMAMIVAMAKGWSKDKCRPYVARMVNEVPQNLGVQFQVMQYLMPRWHGGPDDCANFAKSLADKIGGASGDAMYARLLITQVDFYREEELLSATKMDAQRALKGLEHLAKSKRDAAFGIHWGLRIAAIKQDAEFAKKFYDLMQQNHLDNDWQIGWWNDEYQYNEARRFALGKPRRSPPPQPVPPQP